MSPVRFGMLAALAVSLYGQSKDAKPQDITGWDKIQWGMTIAEAASAYGVAPQPETKDDWTLLQLKPIKIAGVEVGVQVGAKSGAKGITLVRLWSYFGLANSAPGSSAQDFDTLRAALIQKYGDPAKEEMKRGENFRLIKTVLWTFPSTSIIMTLEQSSSLPNLGNIILDFTATGK
jgi:hypothetical protein